MFLSEMRMALRRRWYLLLAGLFCAGGAGFGAYQAIGPAYTVVAETLLLPPTSILPTGGNPYLQLGDLSGAVDVVAKAMTDPIAVRQLDAQGLTADYTVERDQNSPAPMALMTITASTSAEALRAKELLIAELPVTLQQLQERDGIPAARQITTTVVMNPDKATPSHKTQIRAAIATVIVIAMLTLLLTAAIDALIVYPRRRRSGSITEAGVPTAQGHPASGAPQALPAHGFEDGSGEGSAVPDTERHARSIGRWRSHENKEPTAVTGGPLGSDESNDARHRGREEADDPIISR